MLFPPHRRHSNSHCQTRLFSQERKNDHQESTSVFVMYLFIRSFRPAANRQLRRIPVQFNAILLVFRSSILRPDDNESELHRRRGTCVRQSIDLAAFLSTDRTILPSEDPRIRPSDRALPSGLHLSRTWTDRHLHVSKTKVKPGAKVRNVLNLDK